MIDKKQFIECMSYLKAYYPNFNFDLTNKMQLQVWYQSLNMVDDLPKSIMNYIKNNKFPPQSPTDLINIQDNMNEHEAWECILAVINRSFNNSSFLNIMAKEYPSLYPYVKLWNIEDIETDDEGNKCYGYIFGRNFKREYRASLDKQMLIVNNSKEMLAYEKQN